MRRVKALTEIVLEGRKRPAGSVHDVDDDLAERLIAGKYAEAFVEAPEPAPVAEAPKPVEAASVDTGEKAIVPKVRSRRVL